MRRAPIAFTGALLIGAGALLTGCASGAGAPAASDTPVASPTASVASPTASTPAVPSSSPAALPASCDDLGTAETRQQTVGGLTAQHADGFVRPSPANATTVLSCNWIQEEAAAVLLIVSTAPAADITAGLEGLGAQGFECQPSQDFGAQYCAKTSDTPETEDVVVAGDGKWLYLETVNINARPWLSEITSQIFG